MLRWRRSQSKNADELDEHSAPTEPLLPAVEETVPTGEVTPPVFPAPLPYEQPFPQQQAQGAPQQQGPYSPPAVTVYPVLPPAPTIQQGHRPAGSVVPIQPQNPGHSARSGQSVVPMLVGVFFVTVQFLLLINFIAGLISLSPYQQWLQRIYEVSSIFLRPFHLLFEHITLPLSPTVRVEVYTLLAILVYGLLSRLLVRLLKVLLRSR
jgi:hypothetical protein